ncbi:MAG: 3-phosphoshikimate 1-carboxyvinyltransferase [Clostridium sp.]|nr:3-phosphoshikimate 1-carboxyvinyltransferase [Clostridium sp.]MCM1547197.1 3-phosphoshikimate 1-carboxyvinyltransferase [Ruminococcus sp.]
MDIEIIPSKLKGEVSIPSSKSMTHRMLICAAMSKGTSVISNVTFSKDIYATIDALKTCGAEISVSEESVTVKGIENPPENAEIDCCESGSTLRFMIPVTAALGINAIYKGQGRLPERPITPYLRELTKNGITFDYGNTMPFAVKGKLKSGVFEIEGDISSQFITGLLFALPLLDGDSEIRLMSKLESKPYADMTISCLDRFGVEILETQNGYSIKGGQKFIPINAAVEGDYSQAAFFYAANFLGSDVKINNLFDKSVQGDKKIVEIIKSLCYNNNDPSNTDGFNVDASDIPDLVPILGVIGTFSKGRSVIYNAARLKIKESDRLETTANALNALGGRVTASDDGLVIEHSELKGGTVDSAGDHRIAMSAAIASTVCTEPVIIKNAGSVEKSYPDFFKDYINLGGTANVINME